MMQKRSRDAGGAHDYDGDVDGRYRVRVPLVMVMAPPASQEELGQFRYLV